LFELSTGIQQVSSSGQYQGHSAVSSVSTDRRSVTEIRRQDPHLRVNRVDRTRSVHTDELRTDICPQHVTPLA